MNVVRLFAVFALLPVVVLGGAVLGMVAGLCRVIDFMVGRPGSADPLFGGPALPRAGVNCRVRPASA